MADSVPAVVTKSTTDVAENERPNLSLMIRNLAAQATFAETTGTDDFVMDIMEKILSAETEDEIFAAQEAGVISGKDFAGRPFRLLEEDIQWRKSTIQTPDVENLPIYALMKVTALDTGEEEMLGCGGKTFVATLFALIARDAFDTKKYPDGRTFVLRATATPSGSRLSLLPYKVPDSGKAKAK